MNRSLLPAVFAALWLLVVSSVVAQPQMETLDRGLVAVRTSATQVYLGWRFLGTDAEGVSFNLYRSIGGGAPVLLNSAPLTATTDYRDTPGSAALDGSGILYTVRPVLGGVEGPVGGTFSLPAGVATQSFLRIPLQVPAGGTTPSGEAYTYTANDASPADLDGDGDLDIVLKWDPSNAKDNSQGGYTGNVYLDGYRLDGTRLWRIDLGRNIRAGAHYTQFMAYDLDGDGRAEVSCKTAPGTIDGAGNAVLLAGDSAAADYRNSSGYILSGPEYLTVFDGLTGAALATTAYVPGRGNVGDWGDTYGNRVDRFVAGVAYLDGNRPSLVMCRGYYTQTHLVAWDWRNGVLSQRWWFNAPNNSPYAGQGNHQLSVADVDADGKQEIVYGNMVVDDNGTGLHTTGLGHSDALHVSDFLPSRPGIEVFTPQEYAATNGNVGTTFRDARTGALIWTTYGNGDIGRACMMDIDPRYPGAEAWATNNSNIYSAYGQVIATKPSNMFHNFGVWWDADPQRELLDGTTISDWNFTTSGRANLLTAGSFGAASNNSTKATPCISGDLLGDWREEVVWRTSDNTALLLFTTTIAAVDRRRTFLHDPQYRVALAWQNAAYNQPPHPSFEVASAPAFWTGGYPGTWTSSGSSWSVDGAAATTLRTSDYAIFTPTTAGTVTVSGTVTPQAVIHDAAADLTLTGGRIQSTGTLTKAGAGVLRLAGQSSFSTQASVMAGQLLFSGGSLTTPTLQVFPGGAVGGPGTLTGTLAVSSGASLALSPSGPLNVTGNATLGSAISVVAAAGTTPTPGTYTLLTYTGTLSAGVVFGWATPGFSATFDTSVAGVVTVTLAYSTVVGPDTLRWTGAASSTWDLATVNWTGLGGATSFENGDSVLFDGASAVTAVTVGASVAPSSMAVDASTSLTLSGSGAITGATALTKAGTGNLTLGLANTFTGGTTITGGTITVSNANALGTGTIGLQGGTLSMGALTLNNALQVTGTGKIIGGSSGGAHGIKAVSGSGVLTLEATSVFDFEGSLSAFSGLVKLTGSGSFRLFGSSGSAVADFDLGAKTLSARSGTGFSLGSLAGESTAVLSGAGGYTASVLYTVGENGNSTTFAGKIQDGTQATKVTKKGTGRLLLTGANTYTGVTTVSEGTLAVTGSLAATTTSVAAGATLGGTGTLGGPVSFATGAKLGVGIATDDIRGLSVTGDVTCNGSLIVVPVDLGGSLAEGTFTILTYSGALLGAPVFTWSDPSGSPLVATFDAATTGLVRMTLADPRPLVERWREAVFGAAPPVGIAGNTDDADGDGIPNLIEYAIGGDALAPAPTSVLQSAPDVSGRLQITLNRIADPALTYIIEAKTSLSEAAWTEVWRSSGAQNVAGSVTVPDSVVIPAGGSRFLRLRVE